MSNGGGATPPSPSAVATATTESQAIDQNGPYGSLNWSKTGTNPDGTPIYSENTTLAPQQQSLLSQQEKMGTGLGGAEGALTSEIGGVNPALNPDNLQSEFNGQQSNALQSSMGYLNPVFNQQTQQLGDTLANQGINEESNPAAYANAESLLSNTQGQATQQAINQSYGTGLQGESQAFGQGATESNLPIQQLQAVSGLASPSGPQFNSSLPNTSYANAANAAYQGNLASANNTASGLYGLGGAALTAYGLSSAGGSAAAGSGLDGLLALLGSL
jgi:hypothetical protein